VNKIISEEHRRYLSELPFMLQLEFRSPFHHIKLAMVHGSISSNNEYVQQDTPDEYLLEMLDTVNADVLLMGHTHIPWHKVIFCEEENRKIYRHIINAGSVGKSKSGDTDAHYCIVQIHHNTDLSTPGSVQVQFRQVPYDTQQVIDRIKETGLPDAYDNYLKK
jgi:hypothetical protein